MFLFPYQRTGQVFRLYLLLLSIHQMTLLLLLLLLLLSTTLCELCFQIYLCTYTSFFIIVYKWHHTLVIIITCIYKMRRALIIYYVVHYTNNFYVSSPVIYRSFQQRSLRVGRLYYLMNFYPLGFFNNVFIEQRFKFH